MATLIVLAAAGLCAAVLFAGIVGVVSVASRREDKNRTLTGAGNGTVVRVGRWVNGVYVRAPVRTAAAGQEATLV